MKSLFLSATILALIFPNYYSLGADENSTALGPHLGCQLLLKDKEPPHSKLVGKEFEKNTDGSYKVENEAGTTAAQCVNGFAGGYECSNVDLLSMLDIGDLDVAIGGSTMANDIWGWTDTESGREFALIGLYKGTAFVEITDPVNPVYLGGLPTEDIGSDWRDIKTVGNFAVIVSEESSHGMQVFDLTELLTALPGTTFSKSAHYTEIGSSHNVFVNEDTEFVYVVGAGEGNDCRGGLHMVDMSDGLNPTFAGCYEDDGYTHDVQCVIYDGPDSDYTGREICFCSNEDTITIVDVEDKSNPTLLDKRSYGSSWYTHQGWLTEDQSYFIFNDELDEVISFGSTNTKTHVMDVRTLTDIRYVGNHRGRSRAIDHNHYVVGDYLYQANYRAGFNVLKIIDVANAEFEESGYFDIYPNSNSNSFNGAWSSYPFFPSGTIVVSGIEQGLFMLKFNGATLETCTDSPLKVPVNRREISCTNLPPVACDYMAAETHCPDSCNVCSQYECSDSIAPFIFAGNEYDCETVSNLPSAQLELACGIDEVKATCRATCDFCA